jgi:hypothetical protein
VLGGERSLHEQVVPGGLADLTQSTIRRRTGHERISVRGGRGAGQRVIRKVSRRLLPFMGLVFFINYLDRTNIGFGKLTMSKDLGLTDTMFGLAMFLAAILVLLLRGAPARITSTSRTRTLTSRISRWTTWCSCSRLAKGSGRARVVEMGIQGRKA